jgi:hypothetical protein
MARRPLEGLRLYRISTAGAVTYLGDMDHVPKGIVIPEPSFTALTHADLGILVLPVRLRRPQIEPQKWAKGSR